MAEMLEIRWHGRGGQGAKTAALLFAEAAAAAGKFIQAFPEYGPERMGAPVISYNRVSEEPITLHSGIESPQYVAVLDPSFVGSVDFTAGVPDGGVIIINTGDTPAEMRNRMGLKNMSIRLCTVDASAIAQDTIGRAIPNTPMLGAIVKATGTLDLETVLVDVESKMKKKFRDKPEIVQGNVDAIRRAYEEVVSE